MNRRGTPFPQELVDNIIDFVQDDYDALGACSLVNSAWLARSRLHLFSQISLSIHPSDDSPSTMPSSAPCDCARLYEACLSSPIIATYIKDLDITEDPDSDEEGDDPYLLLLLNKLRSLVSLQISPIYETSTPVNWSSELLSSIAHVVQLASFRILKIQGFTFGQPSDILYIIKSCPGLEELDIEGLTFISSDMEEPLDSIIEDAEWTSDTTRRASLETITLSESIIAEALMHPLSPIDISTLKNVTIHVGEAVSSMTFLDSIRCLEYLDIELTPYVTNSRSIDLSRHRNLSSLSIRTFLLLDRFDPLTWMLPFLSTVQAPNNLDELLLSITIDLPPPHMSVQRYTEAMDNWKRLDKLLCGPKFTSLSRVRIDFELDNPIEDRVVPVIRDHILRELKDLNDKGILHVDTY